MKIALYQIDAFTGSPFGGNPAAVCPLEEWLPEETMQSIAAENNLSETAFFVPCGDAFALRWFTPVAEIDLAGHPTLATAYVIFEFLDLSRKDVRFQTKSGELTVARRSDKLAMDFPSLPPSLPRSDLGDIAGFCQGRAPRVLWADRDGTRRI